MEIEMQTVEGSDNIYAVGYDEEEQTLRIQFKDRKGNPTATWEYKYVPARTYRELMEAPSLGRYFHQNIRTEYTSQKVEG